MAEQEGGRLETAETVPPSQPQPEAETTYETVLVVSAHPDDPDFSAGGTAAKFARSRARVVYVVCSDGSQGGEDPAVPDEELVALREREQREAAAVLGVPEVVFLGFRDGYLYPSIELRSSITRQIRRFRPQLVITHTPYRQAGIGIGASHPDHIAVGEATSAAVYPDARNPRAYRELLAEGLEAFKVKELWYSAFVEANHFVGLSRDLFELKLQALSRHGSQFALEPAANLEEDERFRWMLDRHREAGQRAGDEFGEAFHRIVIER